MTSFKDLCIHTGKGSSNPYNKPNNLFYKDKPCQYTLKVYQELEPTNKYNTEKTLLYLREATDTHSKQRITTPAYLLAHYKSISKGQLNRTIRKLYKYFDKNKPIVHISMTKLIKSPGQTHDNLRQECINVLKRCGITQGYAFGVDISPEGIEHIHAIVQYDHLKPYKVFSEHYGWHCKMMDNDRNAYMPEFYNTARYCLNKIYPNKRSYIKI